MSRDKHSGGVTRDQAMAMHPSNFRRLRPVQFGKCDDSADAGTRAFPELIWTPTDTADALADFAAHVEEAVAVVAEDTAVVIDFATRKRIS